MADFTKFRTSMGGFKRSDVTNYIESLCAENMKIQKELRDERDDLFARLTASEKELQEEKSLLQDQLTASEEQLKEQASAVDGLRQQLRETEMSLSSTETALNEAMEMIEEYQSAEPTPDYTAMELEAYRRAEATERLASERAMRLRQKMDDLLDSVSARYEQSGQEIQVLSEDLRTNLQRLQETIAELELVFNETTDNFDKLDDEELPAPVIHAVI